MPCLEMYNNSGPPQAHHHQAHQCQVAQVSQASPPMSPRISFSNDFVESSLLTSSSSSSSRSEPPGVPPPSSDFQFSVSNYNMMSADELFFKGRILPFSFKDNTTNTNNGTSDHSNTQIQRTLRDQLLFDDDQDQHHEIDFSVKPSKSTSSNGWKGFLGLRKSHIGSKKPDKNDFSFDPPKRFSFSPEDPNPKSSQGMVSNEGSSSSDMGMGI